MLIGTSNLGHAFNGRSIFEGVNLSLDQGTTVALVGPSGSGKTTMLSILGGLLAPSSGELVWNNRRVRAIPRYAVSWVPQSPVASPRRSALDNVRLGAFAREASSVQATHEAGALLAAMGLGQVSGTRANRLSGGELQRVAIARAVMSQTAIVCADEPTGQLDADATSLVLDHLFGTFAATETLVLIATHDEAVWERCAHIIHISHSETYVT